MRYRLRCDAVVEADDYGDALRRIGEHFLAWAADTRSDDPDTWTTDHSRAAHHVGGPGSFIHLIPEPD